MCLPALERIATILDSDLLIMPSSRHEIVITATKHGGMTKDDTDQMVREVNATEVSEDDFLSNHSYFYSLSEHNFI